MKRLILILCLITGLSYGQDRSPFFSADFGLYVPDTKTSEVTGFGTGLDLHFYQPMGKGMFDTYLTSIRMGAKETDEGEGDLFLFAGTGAGYYWPTNDNGSYLGPTLEMGYRHLKEFDILIGAEMFHTTIDPIKFSFAAQYSALNNHFIFSVNFGYFLFK